MPPSYRLVDYSLRPAKSAERKMLATLLRRLEPFQRVEDYLYVGFGSIYFTDFQLFHQWLGISNMVSIEKDKAVKPRFEFNKPFRCVRLEMEHSNIALPKLDWESKCVVWLDYDGKLDKSVLADAATFSVKARSGSLLVISLNVEPERMPGAPSEQVDACRVQSLTEAIGEEKIPRGTQAKNLRAGEVEKVVRHVLIEEVKAHLQERSAPLPEEEKLSYRPLLFLRYSDDAEMMTLGGIVCSNKDSHLIARCQFDQLPFVSEGELPYRIKAPKLTQKEIRSLNAQLPHLKPEEIQLPGVPESDIENYSRIYRYYPSFSEVVPG